MATPVWDPVDEAESELKAAFAGLNDAATKAIIQGILDTPNRFVLHTRGYYGWSPLPPPLIPSLLTVPRSARLCPDGQGVPPDCGRVPGEDAQVGIPPAHPD